MMHSEGGSKRTCAETLIAAAADISTVLDRCELAVRGHQQGACNLPGNHRLVEAACRGGPDHVHACRAGLARRVVRQYAHPGMLVAYHATAYVLHQTLIHHIVLLKDLVMADTSPAIPTNVGQECQEGVCLLIALFSD